jgi:hypothetical protein
VPTDNRPHSVRVEQCIKHRKEAFARYEIGGSRPLQGKLIDEYPATCAHRNPSPKGCKSTGPTIFLREAAAGFR